MGSPSVDRGSPGGEERREGFEELEPWPEPVAGAALLDDLQAVSMRYLVLPKGGPEVLSLWALHTWVYDSFDVTPRLCVRSPTKRCGKTRALLVLQALVWRLVSASNVTAAAVFHSIEQYRPTLLIDEADTFLRGKHDLRGVLNSGHARASAFVLRAARKDGARTFSTWAPCMVALIGKLPPALEDRSISILMHRRIADEVVDRLFESRLTAELLPLRRRCLRWALDNRDALREIEPTLPPGLDDRAADNWRPLLAIASRAGGPWPAKTTAAAVLLSAQREDADDSRELLALADLRDHFEATRRRRLASHAIVEAFAAMEERPWSECRRGGRMTPRSLADLLRPFGIRARNIRQGDGRVTRGYHFEDCSHAFARYLRPPSATALPRDQERA